MIELWKGMMNAVLDESDRTVLKMLLEKDMVVEEIQADKRTQSIKCVRTLGWLEENVLIKYKDGKWSATSEGRNFYNKFNNES